MSELSRRGALLIEHPALAPPPLALLQGRACRYRRWRRTRACLGASAVVAVAVAAGGVAWSQSAGPARMAAPAAVRQAGGTLQMLPAPEVGRVPSGVPLASAAPGTWRLASYITAPPGWSRTTDTGPAAGGFLSCPQVGTCYYAGTAGGGGASGPGPAMDTLWFSRDGGLSWTAIRLPGGATFTTALACPAGGGCLAGGEVSGQPVLLTSGDGGAQWSYRALPAGDGTINELTCPAAGRCDALASASGHASFLHTSDAGAQWTKESFSSGAAIAALSCVTAADCVAIGTTSGDPDSAGLPPGVALRTTDSGLTWTAGKLPAGLSFPAGSFPSVACTGQATCYALGLVPVPTPSCVIVTGPGGAKVRVRVGHGVARHPARPHRPLACKPTDSLQPGSAAAVSTDGGASWRLLAMPPDTPQPDLFALSCPTALNCSIAGQEAVSQAIPGGGVNGGSAMILATSDGGATWTKATFAVTALPSGQQADSLMSVGEIACAAVHACVGVGVADQGSRHTPVYTDAGR
jgi:photosystem II stability/assembly factor-like uncharacterized protein